MELQTELGLIERLPGSASRWDTTSNAKRSPAEGVSNAPRTPADSQSEITNPKREQAEETAQDASMEHTMELPRGGPALKIRGFFDVNLGLGADANPHRGGWPNRDLAEQNRDDTGSQFRNG
jgi:hypothetical protein